MNSVSGQPRGGLTIEKQASLDDLNIGFGADDAEATGAEEELGDDPVILRIVQHWAPILAEEIFAQVEAAEEAADTEEETGGNDAGGEEVDGEEIGFHLDIDLAGESAIV